MHTSDVESDSSILEPSGSMLHLLGLCTGSLPAAVASVARNTNELFQSGTEIVVIAFQLAHELKIRAKHIGMHQVAGRIPYLVKLWSKCRRFLRDFTEHM